MIYGIGTDIVEIRRIQGNLDRHGRRFAERILTPQEMAEFDASARPAHFLSKRFAAKEALVKALGTGFRHGISLKHIEVGRDEWGKPLMKFLGEAANRISSANIGASHLSLSDETEYAVAFVVLERN
ncbi:MAG: holo-ACP synthase [Gammaproteobacteria bacterium]|nr:holo-ACP synthase [Gammaproteobacteria bacterium]